jgi:hypothetical protein
MKWSRLFAVMTPLGLTWAILYGCSGADRPAAGTGGGNPTLDQGCSTDGQTRPCHNLVSMKDGVRICSHGTQVCSGGMWSACGAYGENTLESTNYGIGLDDIGPIPTEGELKALSGSLDAAGCNPCDPDCRGYDVDAGPLTNLQEPDANVIVPLESTPPGFVNQLLRNGGSPGHCEWYGSPAVHTSQNGWAASACQADFFCKKHCLQPGGCPGGGDSTCVKFREQDPAGTHAAQRANGDATSCVNTAPDLTIASPCRIGGAVAIAVCNRGSGPVAVGERITVSGEPPGSTLPYINTTPVDPGDLTSMASCRASSVDCQVTLTQPLNPGQCMRVIDGVHCTGGVFNGNKLAQVNTDRSIVECALQTHYNDGTAPLAEHGMAGTTFPPQNPGEAPLQQACSNNLSAWNSSQLPLCPMPYVQRIVTVPYEAQCPVGAQPRWTRLGWSSSVPTGTEILFEVRVRQKFADGTFGPWTPWTLTGRARTGQDPQNCTMTGTPNAVVGSGLCPKDLFTFLGGLPAASYPDLELRVTLNPSSTLAPTLYDYYLTYTCVDSE